MSLFWNAKYSPTKCEADAIPTEPKFILDQDKDLTNGVLGTLTGKDGDRPILDTFFVEQNPASTVVGVTVLFGRRAEPGEFVEIGDRAGRVVEVTLVDVVLEDENGVEMHVPHFAWLTRSVRCLGAAPRVVVRATLQRSELTDEARARLHEAAEALGADPRVEVEEIAATSVRIALSVISDELGARAKLNAAIWTALSGEGSAPKAEG